MDLASEVQDAVCRHTVRSKLSGSPQAPNIRPLHTSNHRLHVIKQLVAGITAPLGGCTLPSGLHDDDCIQAHIAGDLNFGTTTRVRRNATEFKIAKVVILGE